MNRNARRAVARVPIKCVLLRLKDAIGPTMLTVPPDKEAAIT